MPVFDLSDDGERGTSDTTWGELSQLKLGSNAIGTDSELMAAREEIMLSDDGFLSLRICNALDGYRTWARARLPEFSRVVMRSKSRHSAVQRAIAHRCA